MNSNQPRLARRVIARLAPPKSLGGRVRWLFLLFALFYLVNSVPRILAGQDTTVQVRMAALGALAALAWWWVYGYRRNGFARWAAPVEAAAFFLIGLGLNAWVASLGMLFAVVAFRGLYGGWRTVAGYCAVMIGACTLVVAVIAPEAMGPYLQQVTGVPTLAIFTAVMSINTVRQERAHAREQLFSQVGAALATTSDREIICRTAADAAHRMLADTPGAWAAVTLVGDDGERVACAAGDMPSRLLAEPVDRSDLPSDVAAAFRAGTTVFARHHDDPTRPVEYSLESGTEMAVPLHTDKRVYGALLAAGRRPALTEIRASVEALAAQTTLGLVNADYAADLRHRAFHDALTGLANRALLREHLARAIERAARGTPLAVLLIDLDGFKQVNDVHGHAAGDHLLVTVAQRLRDAVRGADTAARLGGDEFAVVLDGMDAAEDTHFVATRLLAAIQAPVQLPDGPITPRASIGVATWHGHDIDALMHDADLAMYAAKTAGKGKVVQHLADTGVA
jgi:diguanylate cyclase (GGDEF)-like protein